MPKRVLRKTKPTKPTKPLRRIEAAKPKPYSIEDGVTQSLLGGWVNCRRSARIYLDGWRSPTTKESLAFGGLFHELLEHLYKGIRAGKMSSDVGDSPARLKRFFNARIKAWRQKIMGWASPVELETVELCIAKAAAVFPGYCEKWAGDFDPRIWLELEGVFDVEWHDYRLRGRIDGVRRSKDGKLWILETKTMGQVTASLDDALAFDFQTLFYVTAAQVALGRPVAGAIYNVVRRPGHKVGSKANPNEALKQYTARVASEVGKKPDHFYKRFELTFSPAARARFEAELVAKLCDFKAWCAGGAFTYGNERACRAKWTCDWLKPCSSGGSMVGFVEGGKLFEELD